jgi:hypothetical protein
MNGRPYPEIPCKLCRKPLDLRTDLSADENGKAVHTRCYVERITSSPQTAPLFGRMRIVYARLFERNILSQRSE